MKFSAIDIGTNAARLLVGEVVEESSKSFVKKISYTRIPLRLGDDVFSTGMVGTKKRSDLIKTLRAFEIISDIFDVKRLQAVATSAMREAENGTDIVDEIKSDLEIDIQIISGSQEAELILGTFMLLGLDRGNPFAVIDVGGGSTEVNIFKGGEKVASNSFKVGTIRLLKGKIKKDIWSDIKDWISASIDSSEDYLIFGTGGNINKAHKLLGLSSEDPIGLNEMSRLHEMIRVLTPDDRMKRFQLRPDRADVIVPALDIYIRILNNFKASSIFVPRIGLSDGMIYQMFLEENLD
jgi:exopolyphosphatase/guanosine-5'-triphosphate,3'-diphosphate pyrophosphatase